MAAPAVGVAVLVRDVLEEPPALLEVRGEIFFPVADFDQEGTRVLCSRPTLSVRGERLRADHHAELLSGTGECATIVAMSIQPLRYVRDHLSELIDQVDREHDRVEVTRNGRVIAVILSSEELTALEETLAVLADPEVLSEIRAADVAYASDDVVRGVDAVRALRPPTA